MNSYSHVCFFFIVVFSLFKKIYKKYLYVNKLINSKSHVAHSTADLQLHLFSDKP